MFHDAIFARVIRDHDEDPFRLQPLAEPIERALEASDLVVHRDAHRLKEPGEIRRPGTRPERAADRANQIIARSEGPIRPPADDLARETHGAPLVGILSEDRAELDLVRGRKQCRGIASGVRAHAHVERNALTKGEAARGIIELMRGDAEVEQNAVEPRPSSSGIRRASA